MQVDLVSNQFVFSNRLTLECRAISIFERPMIKECVLIGPGAFRLVLALAVVVSHISSFDIGRPAVVIFFILSGYWVAKMYEEAYRVKRTIGIFYISRLMRIWLPFSVAFLIAFLYFAMVTKDAQPNTLAGLLLFGIATNELDPLGVSWSLDLELQFYLALPLILFGLRAMRMSPIVTVQLVFALAISFFTAVGWYLLQAHDLWTFLVFLPAFAVGIAIWRFGVRPEGKTATVSLLAFCLAGAVLLALPDTRGLLIKTIPSGMNQDIFAMAWAILLVPFVAHNVRVRSSRLDMHAGNFSYPLYICHFPIVHQLSAALVLPTAVEKPMVAAVAILVSLIFYLVVDRPLDRVRANVVSRMSRRLQVA